MKEINGFVSPRYLDEKWFNSFTITKNKSKSNDIPVIIIFDKEAYESNFIACPKPTYKDILDELSEARRIITKLDKSNRIPREAYSIENEYYRED